MTTVDVLIVAKESILIEKFKKNVKSHFFCPILYIYIYRVYCKVPIVRPLFRKNSTASNIDPFCFKSS